MSLNKPMLQISNIYKSFEVNSKKTNVLANISFSVKYGEFVCILGHSGIGKTTLLRILAGFCKQDSGTILLNGVEKNNINMDVLMVFQDFNQIFPWKTVKGNITHTLLATKTAKNRTDASKLADEILLGVDLVGYENYYPHQLSGGMRQRVAVARALVLNPKILLMDEPFASLDSKTRKKLQELTKKICNEKNTTVIFVTHNIEEAVELADRILILSQGQKKTKVHTIQGKKTFKKKQQLLEIVKSYIHKRR